MTKACTQCGEVKPLTGFYKRPGGHFAACKACVLKSRRERYERDGDTLRARVRDYQQRNPEKVAEVQRAWRASESGKKATRRHYLKATYGISADEFDRMFAQQGGRCAVCRTDEPGKCWTVDHDHVTGAVRGILCWHCNVGLGHFRDDASNLIAAADYLLARSRAEGVA